MAMGALLPAVQHIADLAHVLNVHAATVTAFDDGFFK